MTFVNNAVERHGEGDAFGVYNKGAFRFRSATFYFRARVLCVFESVTRYYIERLKCFVFFLFHREGVCVPLHAV